MMAHEELYQVGWLKILYFLLTESDKPCYCEISGYNSRWPGERPALLVRNEVMLSGNSRKNGETMSTL